MHLIEFSDIPFLAFQKLSIEKVRARLVHARAVIEIIYSMAMCETYKAVCLFC